MSKEKSDTPRNVAGLRYHKIESYTVAEFHPEDDGKCLPTEVHILLDVPSLADHPIVMRLKSRAAAMELIETLAWHCGNVWPASPRET